MPLPSAKVLNMGTNDEKVVTNGAWPLTEHLVRDADPFRVVMVE